MVLGQLHEVRPGRRLYVQTTWGDPEGVFAHAKLIAVLMEGAMCNHGQWDPQIRALTAAGITAVCYDLLGCGDSDKPRQDTKEARLAMYSPEAAYQDLVAIVAQFTKGYDSVLLMGHSYGGPTVLRLAAECPKRIAGVVALGIGYPEQPHQRDPAHSPWVRLAKGARAQGVGSAWYLNIPESLLALIVPYVAATLMPRVYHPHTFKHNPALVKAEWWAWSKNKAWVIQALSGQIGELIKDFDAFKRIVQKVEAPGLIINQESAAPPGQTSPELMAADMQDGQGFAVPVSYHQVHQDQPDVVNKLILHFLRTKVCHTQV